MVFAHLNDQRNSDKEHSMDQNSGGWRDREKGNVTYGALLRWRMVSIALSRMSGGTGSFLSSSGWRL